LGKKVLQKHSHNLGEILFGIVSLTSTAKSRVPNNPTKAESRNIATTLTEITLKINLINRN